jgi:hypothetical protein
MKTPPLTSIPGVNFFVFVTAPSKYELPRSVAPYLSKEKRAKMDRLIKDGNFSVKFIDYDWSTHNSVNTTRYEKGDLSGRSFPFTRNPQPPTYDKDETNSKRKI